MAITEGLTTLPTDSGGTPELGLYDGTDLWLPRGGVADGVAGHSILASGGMRWNGSGWDRAYNGNQGITLLGSSARTTTASALVHAYNWAGMEFALSVSAISGGAALTFAIYDALTGTLPLFQASASINTVTSALYHVHSGPTTTPTGSSISQLWQFDLPGQFFAVVAQSVGSATYTLTSIPILKS